MLCAKMRATVRCIFPAQKRSESCSVGLRRYLQVVAEVLSFNDCPNARSIHAPNLADISDGNEITVPVRKSPCEGKPHNFIL
jgi:hypothetical protein